MLNVTRKYSSSPLRSDVQHKVLNNSQRLIIHRVRGCSCYCLRVFIHLRTQREQRGVWVALWLAVSRDAAPRAPPQQNRWTARAPAPGCTRPTERVGTTGGEASTPRSSPLTGRFNATEEEDNRRACFGESREDPLNSAGTRRRRRGWGGSSWCLWVDVWTGCS